MIDNLKEADKKVEKVVIMIAAAILSSSIKEEVSKYSIDIGENTI